MFGNNTLYHVYLFTVCGKTVRTQCEKHAGSNTEYLVLVACMVFRVLTVLPTKALPFISFRKMLVTGDQIYNCKCEALQFYN